MYLSLFLLIKNDYPLIQGHFRDYFGEMWAKMSKLRKTQQHLFEFLEQQP